MIFLRNLFSGAGESPTRHYKSISRGVSRPDLPLKIFFKFISKNHRIQKIAKHLENSEICARLCDFYIWYKYEKCISIYVMIKCFETQSEV